MDKSQFLKAHGLKSKTIKVGNDELVVNELNLAQRERLTPVIRKSPAEAQYLVVCMGCDFFDENDKADLEAVRSLNNDVLTELADHILDLSGLGDESAEKNS